MIKVGVESGIPVPPKPRPGGGASRKYPFPSMEVGDSFFMPKGKPRVIATAACMFARPRGWKFTCRVVDGGVRVWRVK